MMTREQIDLAVFRIHILSQALLEAIDELKGTPIYRHRIKTMVNTLHDNLLVDINKTIAQLYNEDEELMLHMGRSIDAIIESLANDSPAVIASYPRMIEMVKQEELNYNANNNKPNQDTAQSVAE